VNPGNQSTFAIIILAAGESNRMRIPKQLLPFRGKNMLQHAIDEASASQADIVLAVLGANAERIKRVLRTSRATLLMNPDWRQGISSSIRCGIKALPQSVDAVVISLCDQPHANTQIFNELFAASRTTGKSIVACEYGGSSGTPALFSRVYFDQLLMLEGDRGAKKIIVEHTQDVARVPFAEGSIDIDTAEDYQQFMKNELGIKN
jgi:molybdenum cofactor cytidylyltransferase